MAYDNRRSPAVNRIHDYSDRAIALMHAPTKAFCRMDRLNLVLVQATSYSMQGERRGVSPPVPRLTGGLTPRRSPIALRILH
jgi:hypothetical protein